MRTTENQFKQFMGKFGHEYLLTFQQRHSYDRNIKRSDWFLKIGGALCVCVCVCICVYVCVCLYVHSL